MERFIIHIDCNNAFLSWTAVSMLSKGSSIDIRKRYAVIGGDEKTRHGIVLAKSYLCKTKGVVTGETIYSARKKCPYLGVYPPEFYTYREYSDKMYEYLLQYTDKIERFSIDECFLDYTDCVKIHGNPVRFAYKIKRDIKNLLGFTVNVGVGNNKLLAKMASDFTKPNRVHTLFNYEIEKKMWSLEVDDLFMIGKASSKKLHELGINTIGELAQCDLDFLLSKFKKQGKMMWEFANGIDNSQVETDYGNPKSVSTSEVLPYNYSNIQEIYEEIKNLSRETGRRLRKNNLYAGNVNIWIKYSNFNKISKQVTLEQSTNNDEDIYKYAIILFNSLWNESDDEKIRALCVGVADLSETYRVQLNLFSDNNKNEKNIKLQNTIDEIRHMYGGKAIKYADEIDKEK